MSDGQSDATEFDAADAHVEEWPDFDLEYTFNPDRRHSLAADEVFVFDPDRIAESDTHWMTAERGSYVPLKDIR